MDWRDRKYYCVSFDWTAIDMRIKFLQLLGKVKIRSYQNVPKQPDELEERGRYQYMLGVPVEYADAVEYELRKAERNDDYCIWKEINRNKV